MEYNVLFLKASGIGSLMLFVVANAYYPVRLIVNQFRFCPGEIATFLERYLDIHMWLNVMAFALITVNAYFTEERNITLYASLLVTVWLTLSGILMRTRRFSRNIRKQKKLLHSQQTVFVVWLLLLLFGVL